MLKVSGQRREGFNNRVTGQKTMAATFQHHTTKNPAGFKPDGICYCCTQALSKQKTLILLSGFKWYLQGSNQGHMDFQSIALPSELRYRCNAFSELVCGCKYRMIFNLSKTNFKKNQFVTSPLQINAYAFSDRCRKYQNQVCCI